ncbi:HD-GYP domain-containing protein [Massilia sp. TS11]|uniref:HD-GYP domain-containing protein n=1 Tax=Massilia sp. TS11 TaxID=2908003 RepID=UPI001EDBEB7F|nr:HD domain-containing phosphohydrolase [Massilia sp. TS11]MCG2585247.1 HD domain-containing protein [Massilia sp. TS11]
MAQLPTSVNRHFLSKALALSAACEVVATQDVLAADGERLLRTGGRLGHSLAAILLEGPLQAPLETCLAARGGVDAARIVDLGRGLIERCVPLARILRSVGGAGPAPLGLLAAIEFSPATGLLLSCMDARQLEHSVLVSLMSLGLAKKLRLTEDEQQQAAVAGLLHDVGELYLDPMLHAKDQRLTPQEWAQLISHPRIGQLLVNELESYPLAVGRAISEHHERFDGTGYPRQAAGHALSPIGQAVGVAEMIAGVLNKDYPLERAELALKIVPGEHPADLVSAISGALRAQGATAPRVAADEAGDVERLYWRIRGALDLGENLLDASVARSPRSAELLGNALGRIEKIQRAFISTGLDIYLRKNVNLSLGLDGGLMFEKVVATREICWRLRDIARDLALHASSPHDRTLFAPLINLLDDDQAEVAPIIDAVPAPQALAPRDWGSQPAV